MNDFTITSCSCCTRELMRCNFSNCNDCEELACAHADVNCGIVCPVCDWFVCSKCLKAHGQACWDKSPLLIAKEKTESLTIYRFGEKESLQLPGTKVTYSNGISQVTFEN